MCYRPESPAHLAAHPDRPVADLACGMSGNALFAAAGRQVIGVDIAEVALHRLAHEARR
jgi:hypothetical protein